MKTMEKSRAVAHAAGLKEYSTGKPCRPRQHVSPRRVSNGACIACSDENNARRVTTDEQRARKKLYDRTLREDPVRGAQRRESKRRDRNRDAERRSHLRRLYGLTLEQYEVMLVEQQGVCDICKRGQKHRLFIDHDHTTGQVRGLLCRDCNFGLGQFQDSIEVLRSALAYREKYAC